MQKIHEKIWDVNNEELDYLTLITAKKKPSIQINPKVKKKKLSYLKAFLVEI